MRDMARQGAACAGCAPEATAIATARRFSAAFTRYDMKNVLPPRLQAHYVFTTGVVKHLPERVSCCPRVSQEQVPRSMTQSVTPASS